MKNKLTKILNLKKTRLDKNGIWITNLEMSSEVKTSKKAWEKIFDYDLKKLKKYREEFEKNELEGHIKFIEKSFKFNDKTTYLEIGCGPANIGEYLLKTHNSNFIGVDFNYKALLTLKKYLDEKGYKKYLLIHADINNMPIKSNTIDYIYGGGVIEHLQNTSNILRELYKILKKGGVSFNTVPAFNISWILRIHYTIPSPIILRKISEFIHIKILKNRMLEKKFGYELSFTKKKLIDLHKKTRFKKIVAGCFSYNPQYNKKNKMLKKFFYYRMKNPYFCPVHYVYAKK